MKKEFNKNLLKVKKNYMLYIFLLPAMLYIFLFNYIPMYGVQIAFKNFIAVKGITGSPWVGFIHFERFIKSYQFWNLLKNTLGISLFQLVAGFPAPIILAIAMNYSVSKRLGKFTQTVTYAPHFISTVVMVGMLLVFLSPRSGFVNTLITFFGGQPIFFMGSEKLFKSIYVFSGIWQNVGWGSIIYMATLAGVSPELHEAAIVDGATKLHRVWHIDIPSIMPTMAVLFILSIGRVMSVGFEKVFLMQNSLNIQSSEIISTYVYKIGLVQGQYSFSSAVGLFNNVINCLLLVTANQMSKKITSVSLF